MEPLFKFILHRPAKKNDEESIIDSSQNSNFQKDLATSIGSRNPRAVLRAASIRFTKSDLFINQLKDLNLYEKIIVFKGKLDELIQKKNISQNELKNTVKDAFGDTAQKIINSEKYKNDISNLKDSIIAIKHLSEHHKNPIEELTNALRDLEVVMKVEATTGVLDSGETLKRYRRRPIRLPDQFDMKSVLTRKKEEKKRQKEIEKKKSAEKKATIKNNLELYRALDNAIKEIMNIDDSHLESSIQKPSDGFLSPKDMSSLNLLKEDSQMTNTLGQPETLNIATFHKKGVFIGNLPETNDSISKARLSKPETKSDLAKGITEFKPITNLSTQFRFADSAIRFLSRITQELLKKRNLSITEMSIDKVVAQLKQEMQEVSDELELLTQAQQKRFMKKIGNTMVVTMMPTVSALGFLSIDPPSDCIPDDCVPDSKGDVLPSGIADLIIVKQQLKGYVGGEVAHIENILKGESKVRNHRRFNQTIGDTYTESETIKSEEHELESTDRFELSRETSKTIQSDASLKTGLTISGSYGPTVNYSASAEGSLSKSKTEATNIASTFSKDVTQRSVEALTERILHTNRVTVTTEVEETNNHTLDNTDGEEHISGVYQWVDKLYEAQMYNYGMRMMYDFMIPEPGAFIVEAMQKSYANVFEIEKPVKFSLSPSQLTQFNYTRWVSQYGATGITPAPEEYITKSMDYSAGDGERGTDYTHSCTIQIDDGYRAIQASIGMVVNKWKAEGDLDIVIGKRNLKFKSADPRVWTTLLDGETESIPFGLNTYYIGDIAVTVEVKCQRTSRAYRKWQLNTHAKLTEAYQAKMADYEEKLAEIELQAGVEIDGKNPSLNLEMMKDELKKNSITLLTDQHFDLFDAVETDSNGLPQLDLNENEAEGSYVRFFEQAFEWEHMTWVTYPYFWGRKQKWEERISYEDSDRLFNQFIKAGYCRAVVPVRPGFEGAVDHFMTFGEIWNGGPLPAISSDLYLPIADELAERMDMSGDEVPQGDPWELRVPTNLVKLRSDNKVPIWVKNDNGEWVEE